MAKPTKWDDILEMCLNRIADGETVADCLRDFPDHADQLTPLLKTAVLVREPQRQPSRSGDDRIKAAMLQAHRAAHADSQISTESVGAKPAVSPKGANSPVSSSWFSRLLGQNQPKRRTEQMTQPIFVRFAGAIAALAIVMLVGAFALGLGGRDAQEADAPTPTIEVTPEPTAEPVIEPEPMPNDLAWDYMSDDVASPDGTLTAFAQAFKTTDSDEVSLVIDVREVAGNGYSTGLSFDLAGESDVRPHVIGWSADGGSVYFSAEIAFPQCDSVSAYRGLYRLRIDDDISLSALEVIRNADDDSGYFADLALSADNKQLAMLQVMEEGDTGVIPVLNTDSAEIIGTSIAIEGYGGGVARHRLHWSADSILVAQLFETPCPTDGGATAFQIDGETVFNSAETNLTNTNFEIAQLQDDVLQTFDINSGCVYETDLETLKTKTNCEGTLISNEASEYDTLIPSPDGAWTAKSRTYVGASSVQVELLVDHPDNPTTLLNEDRAWEQGLTTPHLLGWTPDSRYLYYTEVGQADGCANLTNFRPLSRFDTTTRTSEVLRQPVLASVALSPDGTKLALKPLPEGESGAIQIWDTASTDIIQTIELVDNKYEEGAYLTQLHWSDDSSLLGAKLHTVWCPALGGEVAFQIGDKIVFSSNDVRLDDSPTVDFEIVAFTNQMLMVQDKISTCDYTVDLASGAIQSDRCPERLTNESIDEPMVQAPDPAVSPDGEWVVTVDTTENGVDLLDISMTVASGAIGVRHMPVQETREVGFAGSSLPLPLGWSQDSQYVFFADRGFPDGCDADTSIYTNLRRLDVTTGGVELVYGAEMASVAVSFDGQKIAYMPRPYPNNEFVSMTVLDTPSLNEISNHLLNNRYVAGATTNKLHWSVDSESVIAELHTIWCPILDGNIDYWQIDIDGETDLTGTNVGPVFSSSQVQKVDDRSVILSFNQFANGLLQLTESETGCIFETTTLDRSTSSPNCTDRLR